MSRYLKFWGTRGSCPVSGPEYARFGGNTSCLEVSYGSIHLILDAGTGIRPLGDALLDDPREIFLFLSHTHWDHIIGFPFFSPLYSPDAEISIWSPSENKKSCRQLFDELMSAEFFPVNIDELKAKLDFHSIEEHIPVQVGPLTIQFHRTDHPSAAYAFKIQTPKQTIGYATDSELSQGYHGDLLHAPQDASLAKFFSGCDLLIHEAQYFPEEYREKVGWGHSSAANAAAFVRQINSRRWLIPHHDPKHTDRDLERLETFTRNLLEKHSVSCQAEWVGDGHIVELE